MLAPASKTGKKTRERILEAAEEVFVRFGFEGARMDQIAERADVRKANIYYYFDGKESLYRALVDRIVEVLVSEVRDYLQTTSENPWDQLDGFLDLFLNLVQRYQGLIGLAYGELLHPPREEHGGAAFLEVMEQVEQLGVQLIKEGIRRGDFREQDPEQTVLSLQGAIFEYFMIPDARIQRLTGRGKFDPKNLERRRQHLSSLIRRVLEK